MTDRFRAAAAALCLAAGVCAPQAASAQPAAATAAASTPAAQVQPAPRAPFPNRANEVLPSWLRVRGEFRERMEGFDGLGFDDSREDLYWLSRVPLQRHDHRLEVALVPGAGAGRARRA